MLILFTVVMVNSDVDYCNYGGGVGDDDDDYNNMNDC
jgi:hypothetical protein